MKIYVFSITSQFWGSDMCKFCLAYTVNTMAADDQVMEGAPSSPRIMWLQFAKGKCHDNWWNLIIFKQVA